MKIAFVNIFKPREGSGDGITEYTYQLYKKMRKRHKIDFFFALNESKRVDVPGRMYVETVFRLAAKKIIAGNYDIVHLPNPEIGYFAKALKNAGANPKIVVTIHDFVRVVKHSKRNEPDRLQSLYNSVITRNVADSIAYSDFIIFTSPYELSYAKKNYKLPRYELIPIGPKDLFLDTPIPKDKKNKKFTIGYIGGLVPSRHIEFILKTAKMLGKDYSFKIYGTGAELGSLTDYKNKNNLDNVEFMGFAPEKDILKIYDSFDAFMNCSDVDVASLPVEDAFARGLPVIIAKKNIYDESVRDRAYEARDPQHAADIIRKINKYGYPKEKQKRILAYARKLSWENVARKTEKIYGKLLKD